MSKSDTILIAVGGGEFGEATVVLKEFIALLKDKSDPRLTVITVATNSPEGAVSKYNTLFRKHGIPHVSMVDVSQRGDSFNEASLKKIDESDALFFTGGDQLNVTSLLGGSPLHALIHEKVEKGFIIAGTSAGAMMMSRSMITTGKSDNPPEVGGVEIAPGLGLIDTTIIDTHFSQRGRHGRLLTAVAHYPQSLGVGIDERTAIFARGNEFKVVGEGVVTVMDGCEMNHSNLPYREKGETIGLFSVRIHILPAGYKYDFKKREPISPPLKKIAGIGDNKD
jgi:cyanophycinase